MGRNRRATVCARESEMKRKGQSHRLNKSKPVQRRQTICNECQYFLNTSDEKHF